MGTKAIPCVLGEERKIKKFYVFLGCLEERKNVERSWVEGGNFRKMCLLDLGGAWAICNPGHELRGSGLLALILSDRVKLDIFGKVLTS